MPRRSELSSCGHDPFADPVRAAAAWRWVAVRLVRMIAVPTLVVALTGQAVLAVAAPAVAAPAASGVHTPGGFGAVAPTRVLDTRSGVGGVRGAVVPGQVVTVPVLGRAGVPGSNVAAVVVDIVATGGTSAGFVTAGPSRDSAPSTSVVNYVTGQTVSNQVTVAVGVDGAVALRVGPVGRADLVVDVVGYVLGGTPLSAGGFGPVVPTRLLDTRSGTGGTRGPVSAGRVVSLPVGGRAGVPTTGVAAVVVDIVATNGGAGGFVTAGPDGAPAPTTSVLNFVAGQTIANQATVAVGTDGAIALRVGPAGGADLVVDVVGYVVGGTPPAAGGFVAVAPTRWVDTRSGTGSSAGPVAAGRVLSVPVTGRSGIPATGVAAVVVDVVATNGTGGGFVTAGPGGAPAPSTSALNYTAGQTVANQATVAVGADGSIALQVGPAGRADLVVDVVGYQTSGITATAADDQWTNSASGSSADALTNAGESRLTTDTAGGLRQAWTSAGTGWYISGAPVVADGVGYSVDRAGSDTIVAFDVVTGVRLWTLDLSTVISVPSGGHLALFNGVLQLVGNELVVAGWGTTTGVFVAAFDVRSHGLLWEYAVADPPHLSTTPLLVVDGGRAFVRMAGVLHSFDVVTGAPGWSTGQPYSVVAAGGVVYTVSSASDLVQARAEDDGHVLWTAAGTGGQVAVAGTVLYVSNSNSVEAYPARGCGVPVCAASWTFSFPDAVGTADGVATLGGATDDSVFATIRDAVTDPHEGLYGGSEMVQLDARTGAVRWRIRFDRGAVNGPPVRAGGLVWLLQSDIGLLAYRADPPTGTTTQQPVVTYPLPYPAGVNLAVVDGTVMPQQYGTDLVGLRAG